MNKFRGIPISLAAALAAAMAVAPTPAVNVATPGVTTQQDGTKAPPVTAATQIGDLAFLNGYGAERRTTMRGCPWPGNRAACARRTAGTSRRMR